MYKKIDFQKLCYISLNKYTTLINTQLAISRNYFFKFVILLFIISIYIKQIFYNLVSEKTMNSKSINDYFYLLLI